MEYRSINFADKFGLFDEIWNPKTVAEMNDYQFKLVKVEGEFVWHKHEDTDEAFIVLDGELVIELRDGSVTIRSGEMYVVPRGVEHKPRAPHETKVLVVEPRGVVNTGSAGGERTAPNDVWV